MVPFISRKPNLFLYNFKIQLPMAHCFEYILKGRTTCFHSCDPPLKPEIMKILFLRLFPRISFFIIESNFKSCKEILL
jgi:hypothetical protein